MVGNPEVIHLDKSGLIGKVDWQRAPDGLAQTNDFATSRLPAGFLGFLRCKKVLHYWFDWRYICAMLIGYARVSTDDQDTAAQAAALKAASCERIFREKASGGRWDRPELHRLLDQLRKDDVLVVWKLDRLSRSLRDVLTIMERLRESRAGFPRLNQAHEIGRAQLWTPGPL